MEEPRRPNRRISDSGFLARLTSEVEGWERQGTITREQGQEILAGYDLPSGRVSRRELPARLVSILAILGSVLVGLGVIAFLASNWGEISRPTKLVLLFLGIVVAYGAGYWLKYIRGYQRVGSAAILLGALIFGAGIHLIAQMYHVSVNDPKLFSYWFLGVIPLAYVTRSRALLYLAVGLFLGAVGFWLPEWLADDDITAILVFALYLVLGLMLYSLGLLHGLFDSSRIYARTYEVLGTVVALGVLYIFGFRDVFDNTAYHSAGSATEGVLADQFWWLFHTTAGMTLVAMAIAAFWHLRRSLSLRTLSWEGVASVVLLAAAYLPVYLAAGEDVLYPILFNFLLFVSIIGLIFLGYFRDREDMVNAALAAFALAVVTRYFEYSWDLFDRSLVFILAGLLLLAGGYILERGRQRTLAKMRVQGEEHEHQV